MLDNSDLQFYVIGLLLAVLAWIGRTMIAKMDLISKMVNDIDKFIAVMNEKMASSDHRIREVERRLDEHDVKINEIKYHKEK